MTLKLNLCFDLDGTLTDPREGITKCITHALKNLGHTVDDETSLSKYIGPPLRGTFAELLHTQDKNRIEQAMSLYRDRFGATGLYENKLYPAIPAMLAGLVDDGHSLYVVSSKPRVYVEKIIDHFDLTAMFTAVFGPELDGRLDNKSDLLGHVISSLRLSSSRSFMIGDRKEDILAGRKNGLRTIGVTYGYGSREELTGAGAEFICNTPEEIETRVKSIPN
ncbi:MAG: HAD hydrolase-like protein [Dehalococcoidales bacterium]|nr:HAD hydrolase-like protein [Dehalococcoidales bacterium]